MAKQYIPKISGLLTEPNPVDAPSNSLSEAENVIIDQNGKVQARHGLNVKEYTQTITSPLQEYITTKTTLRQLTNTTRNSYDQTYDLPKFIDNKIAITGLGSDTSYPNKTNLQNHYLDNGVNCEILNKCYWSEDFNAILFGTVPAWDKQFSTLTLNTSIQDPFKGGNCYEFKETSDTGEHWFGQAQVINSITPESGTFSLFVKQGAVESGFTYYIRLWIDSTFDATTPTYVDFEIKSLSSISLDYSQSRVVGNIVSPLSTSSVKASVEHLFINGWHRIRLTTIESTCYIKVQLIRKNDSTQIISTSYAGNSSIVRFYVYGAQLTNGSQLLPYIKTNSSSTNYLTYTNTSAYNANFPFIKLIEYKNSSDIYKNILFVKHRKNEFYNYRYVFYDNANIFQYNPTSNDNINRYYIINTESSEIEKYGYIPYKTITNIFNTKNSLYLHSEDGLVESNIDDLDISNNSRFFTLKWPNFPTIVYELKQSSILPNWLYAGYKCAVKMTFYREMGYSDKEDEIYESEPSDPVIISSINKDSIPEITINFPAIYNNKELYKEYIKFTKLNNSRKFGIRLYRTKSVPLSESIPVEYYQCYADIPFDKFFAAKIDKLSSTSLSHSIYGSVKYFRLEYDVNWDQELNIGDTVNILVNEESNDNILFEDTLDFSGGVLYNYIPTKFRTTDTYEILRGYKPAILIVKDKYLDTNSGKYYYLFISKSYLKKYNFSTSSITTLHLPNKPVDFSSILFNPLSFFPIIKTFNINLEFVDSFIYGQPRLYTNDSKDGAENTNLYAPLSENSVQFKDFRVYYNNTKSLSARLFITSQPSVYQLELTPSVISFNSSANPNEFIKLQNFRYTSSFQIPNITNSIISGTNQRYFIDSPVFTKQNMEIKTHDSTNKTIDTIAQSNIYLTKDTVTGNFTITITIPANSNTNTLNLAANPAITVALSNGEQISFTTGIPSQLMSNTIYYVRNWNSVSKTFNISSTPSGSLISFINGTASPITYTFDFMTQSLMDNIKLKTTIFEQSKLTLRLTSNDNIINTVSIKTYPCYNRQGYYNKFNNLGLPDNKAFEFNGSLTESNTFKNNNGSYCSDSLSRFGLDTKIYNNPGNLKNQASFHGRTLPIFDQAGANLTYSSANGGLLTIKNITDATVTSTSKIFDKNAFEAPGHVLIQWQYNNLVYTSIISYSSIESDTTTANTYLFKQAVVVAGMNSFTFIVDSTTIAYLYFLPGTTVNNFSLYPYADVPDLKTILCNLTTTSLTVVRLNYNDTLTNNSIITNEPYFTLTKHNDRNNFEIALFSQDGNIRFQGGTAGFTKTYEELLEEYTWSIINRFNYELQIQNIPARFRKGSLNGELLIDYPNGKKIELKNDYGDHEFFPALAGQSGEYSILAEKTNADWYEKNLINWSRRNIPEITTSKLHAYIGKNTKNIIGAAANVDDLYIFKEDGIWRCTDSGGDIPDLGIYQFATNIVCQAAGSIQEINEEIIFLSQYGFMSITNGGIENISKDIQQDILTLIQTSPTDRIKSFVNQSKQLYYCTLINEVDASVGLKSGTYIFNTKTRQWSFMDQEVLTGIADNKNRNLVAYRQIPVLGTYYTSGSGSGTNDGISYNYPLTKVTEPLTTDTTLPSYLNMYYISRELFTNNLSSNALDQYDFINKVLGNPLSKASSTQLYQLSPSSTETYAFNHRYSFSGRTILLPSDASGVYNDQSYIIADSYVQFLLNKIIYLKKSNGSSYEYYTLKLVNVGRHVSSATIRRVYEFIDTPPTWFTSLSVDANLTDCEIILGVPAKLTFNPESGNQPDTNKLFQEYMIHTETNNKGALMSFKTDSQSSFTTDRRFVYDATATNRNVFRTYIPKNVARGRYLIRRVKHDLPLENLIITGQTIVMRDSGSTRVQKDKDTN